LQMRFGFIPYARHDDVMISYAAPGGGVGPHYDSYDVFLLQGMGRRRWQISDQADLALIEGAPLKILRRFRARREWVLQSGDLLYLPPNHAHHGVALEECITWSIGLRAPGQQEMAARFLDFLQDRLALTGSYRDPGLAVQRHPASIGADMLRRIKAMLDGIRWDDNDIARCLGEYLTEPRSSVVFKRAPGMPSRRFAGAVATRGVILDLKSRMLLSTGLIFINGESVAVSARARESLREFADQRRLDPGARLSADARDILYQWYRAGYVVIG
jgi:50S ribosomal protein L16 3-hydroxylase